MTTTDTFVITEPGVYTMTNDAYHADPIPEGSLSSSGARRLLPPSCPAIFKWEQDNGRPEKRTFDFGHAAHLMVLGDGPELVVIDAANYRTKAAQEERDSAYAEGKVPLLPDEFATVQLMAAALLKHPMASVLFDPRRGKAEQSLFWRDGIWRRARLDWLPDKRDGRMLIADYKTCVSAEPRAVAKAIGAYGYHCQGAWYRDGVIALGLDDDPAFLLVMQEKTPPYLVNVVEPDVRALEIGSIANARAVETYTRCVELDEWPGYGEEVTLLSLPAWLEQQYEEEMSL